MSSTVLPKPRTPAIHSLLHTSRLPLFSSRKLRFPKRNPILKAKPFNSSAQPLYGSVSLQDEYEDDEEPAIGDCLVYEEGIFDDSFLENTRDPSYSTKQNNSKDADISPENLIPEEWMDVQQELNITKKERRKMAQELEYGRRVEKRRQALLPLNSDEIEKAKEEKRRQARMPPLQSEEFEKIKQEKINQLSPVVLDNPKKSYFRENEESGGEASKGRAVPRSPRLAVYGGGLEEVSALFRSGKYESGAADRSQGTRKLFSNEEKSIMNRQIPDVTMATSGKWHPLHTLAAAGEFYLVNSLLKHNLNINTPDKNGLTTIHKAILAKKQAIFNFLLRESANPFVLDNVHIWSLDANQYVADEDDNSYSCRVSGALLLEEIITYCEMDGIDAVIDSIKVRIRESQHQKDNGVPGWWRLREATLFALASVSEQLLQVEVSVPAVGSLLEQILTDDMATGVHDYPFLHARLFSSVAKLSSVMNNQVTEHFLYAAIKTVGMDVPPPVKVGACRALSQLLPDATRGIIQNHALDLFSSLVDLLINASDETMHLILETLQAAVKAGHEISASIEPVISPIILNMWASHVSDPFISIDALEVLEAIKNSPGCIQPLVSRVLPYIGPILSNPQQQPEGLIAGSLDLVTMLVKNAPTDVVKAAHQVFFESIVRIVLQSNDHGEMQNATQCLAAFVASGKQDMLAWCGDPGFTMRSLLDVASRLLDPDLESSVSLFVGSYILQLILHLPTQMAQHIRDLVIALIRRMQSSQLAGLKSSLLLIFARLVHISLPHVEQFIDLLVSVPADGHRNSFAYLMFEWTKQQGEVQGAYQIKVTTTALAFLLLTRHAELGNVNVQGHLIKSQTGITTRSRAKVVPDQWTMMPLPAKILALLADALLEVQEQVEGGGDEDSDWEEVQNGDADDEEAFLYSSAATSHNRPSYDYLDAMAKAFDKDEEEDDDDDELLSSTDPLNEINLVNYLVESLVKLAESDRPFLQHLFQSLTKPQQNAIELVLRPRGI